MIAGGVAVNEADDVRSGPIFNQAYRSHTPGREGRTRVDWTYTYTAVRLPIQVGTPFAVVESLALQACEPREFFRRRRRLPQAGNLRLG